MSLKYAAPSLLASESGEKLQNILPSLEGVRSEVNTCPHKVLSTIYFRLRVYQIIAKLEILVIADHDPVPDRNTKVGLAPKEHIFSLSGGIVIDSRGYVHLVSFRQNLNSLTHPARMIHETVAQGYYKDRS